MSNERFPKAKTIEKFFIAWEKKRVHAFRDVQIFSIIETVFIKNKTNILKLKFVKDKLSEHRKIKSLLKKGLRNWIKDNNITSIYHVINKEEKDEEGNDIQEEYLIRNGNDYLNNLFSNIIKDIVLIPFPENPVVLKNSFVVPFNWVFANDNILYNDSYENKEVRTEFKSNITYDQLTQHLIDFKNEFGIDEKEYNRRIKYFNYIKSHIRKSGIKDNIYFTGSSYIKLGLKNCDLDICIETVNNSNDEDKILLEKLKIIFDNIGMKDVVTHSNTSVRLCKFYDDKENISVDISVGNHSLPKNIQLFRIYEKIDKRFKILALAIKYWIERRGINKGDIIERMINSYTYILLLIYFLQIQSPPILPSGESLQEQVDYLNNYDIIKSSHLNNENIQKTWEEEETFKKNIHFSSLNKDSVGKLLVDYFEYYGFEFNYKEDVVSPRKGYSLSKKEKGWEKNLMGIEDPIDINLNKGGILYPWCFEGIINEFKLAFIKLSELKMDFFKEVCQPLKEINYLPPILYSPIDRSYKRQLLEDYVNSLKE